MQDSLDETDRALINAIQVVPRASWSDVGQVLGINAATAARRWKRITDAGLARVITYPELTGWAERRCMAVVEVDCEPASRDHVISTLVEVPQIASVTIASSGRDLYLTVLTPDLGALSDLVLHQLTGLAGLRRTRTHLVTQLFSEGSKWTLDSLSDAQRGRLTRGHAPRPDRPKPLPESDRDLLLALADGRRTPVELAALTRVSESTARRRLDRVIRDGTISFRCETAQPATGWPIAANFWTRVPPDELEPIASALLRMSEIRMCAAVTGSDNLLISLWLHSLGDSQRFERKLAANVPRLVLTDRTITLRSAKRMGCVLDRAGRSTRVIPIDPWHEAG